MSFFRRGRGNLFGKLATWAAVVFVVAGLAAVTGTATRCSGTGGGLSVALTVRETAGVARQSEPVTSGVPVARSLDLRSTGGLRLVDSSGRDVPAQFQVTSRWGGTPGDASRPVRWVLVDFQASVGANGTATYRLEEGGAGDAAETGLRVTRNDGEYLEITTGAARFAFGKRGFKLFDSVYVGDRRLVTPGSASGIVATDTSGRVFQSATAAPSEVTLETDGTMRKTVRVSGGLSGPGGNLLHYTARISLFSGSTEARVALTFPNRRDPVVQEAQPQVWHIGSPRSAVFRDLTARVACDAGTGATLRLGNVAGGPFESAGGSLKVYQDSSGTGSWARHRGNHPRPQSYVSFRGYRAYRNGSQVASGNQASPWLDYSGSSGGVQVATRDFWQNFPKALRGGGGSIDAALFPDEYAGDYSFRPQEQKTHELLYFFHAPGAGPAALSARAAALQDPLFAAAEPGYHLSSGALGRLSGPTGDPAFAAYEELNRATLQGDGANLYKAIEEADFYSWQDYGEVPIDYEDGGTGTLNQKYNFDLGMMLQFARTGDPRWFRLAEAAGKHIADLDVLHFQGEADAWWEGGFFGHSYHDEDSNSNPNRNEGAPHPDLVFGAPGLFLLYNMTGYRPGYDAAIEISKNIHYRFDNTFGRGNDAGYANAYDYENGCEGTRPFANGLWVLVEAFRATGDASYLASAEWLISNAHKATDLFFTQPVPGDRRFTKLFAWDLLELSLGKYLDMCEEAGRRDGSGARDLLLAMARQEANVIWKTDERGNKGVPYAWMRDGTPWGWEDREVAVNVSNWHLRTADALTYAVIYGGDQRMLDRAKEAFKTGSNPDIEYYRPGYTATKEATNSANFGLVYMSKVHPPQDVKPASERFHEWLCLENPNDRAASVRLNYYLDGGEESSQVVQVPGRSRKTVCVNEAVGGGRDVATTVKSDRPVVAERPMYFNYNGTLAGGHCAVGAREPEKEWYFAEGCTRPGFEQWLTIENPGESVSRVTLTYMLEGEPPRRQQISAPAASRTTLNVNDFLGPGLDVSTRVVASSPVVVERPMYFTYRHGIRGGDNALGATAPSKTWYFAEGTTRSNPQEGFFEEWLCLQNPGGARAHAHTVYMLDSGEQIVKDYVVEPRSRLTVDVNLAVGPGRDVSARIDFDAPLVVERPLYFSLGGALDGGHDALGAASPGKEWHFAEGCTRDGFQTWLCLANPQERQVKVRVDYFLTGGESVSRELLLGPRSRSTIDVNLAVGPGRDVSVRLTAEASIVAERPVYFNYGGVWAGGHDVMGAKSPGTKWHFAEGCTR